MSIVKFGKYKGKDMSECPTDYLFWLVQNTDVHDPKWGASNQKIVDEANAIINSRSDKGVKQALKESGGVPAAKRILGATEVKLPTAPTVTLNGNGSNLDLQLTAIASALSRIGLELKAMRETWEAKFGSTRYEENVG